MAAAAWKTDETMALVRSMALANKSNTEIAAEVTKQFRTFVNGNMIAGVVFKMKLPKRTVIKRSAPVSPQIHPSRNANAALFDWHTGPLPVWGTFAADQFVREAQRRLISLAEIGRRWGIDSKTVHRATVRNREIDRALAATTKVNRDDLSRFAPFATERWSIATIARLVDFCLCGETYANIAEEMHRSAVSIQKKAYRLSLGGVLPKRLSASAEPPEARRKRVASIERQKAVVTDDMPDDDGNSWGRRQTNHGVKTSSIGWRAPVGITTTTPVSRCAWSGCSGNAVGKWCAEHTDLLRRPAEDIRQQLGTWR